MSTESNFISELKYDVKKDSIKQFIFKNINRIIFLILVIFITVILYMFINVYKVNKIEKYNRQLFEIMDSKNVKEQLEDFYNKKSLPKITKTFVGFNLISSLEFSDDEDDKEKIKNIYSDIYNSEDDLFIKYYAGLNLLILRINNNENSEEIENFIEDLLSKQNPLINLVLEQKALYFVAQGKNEEAKNILVNLLKNDLDEGSVERINQYLLYIN